MAVNAEDLLIQPFRDVVALAATAVSNAEVSIEALTDASTEDEAAHSAKVEQMLHAAKALAREGERALRKVQAVWDSQVTNHGDAFRERILKQGSIESRRLRLEDLLWDFDDATVLDEFTPQRYSALQAATKALAMDITETTKRLRLDSPNLTSSTWPLRVFPPLPPLPSPPVRRMTGTHSRKSSGQMAVTPMTPLLLRFPHPGESSEMSVLDMSSNTGINSAPADTSPLAPLESLSAEPAMGLTLSRETTISLSEANPPLSPRADTTSSSSTASKSHRSRLSFWFQSSEETLNTSDSPLLDAASSDTASTVQQPHPGSAVDISQLHTADLDDLEPSSPISPRSSSMLPTSNDQSLHSRVAARPPDCKITDRSTYKRLGGLCPGAIKFRNDSNWSSIVEVSEFSSLGAGSGGEMMRASDGIIPLQFEETTKVGRCSECYYSHDMEEVALDKSLDLQSIRPSPSGANHRLRLLYKSHIRVSLPSTAPPRYACLWCINSPSFSTPREGDATVFPSPNHLLRHLTTHPQPLPPLLGLSVLHGRGAHRSPSLSGFSLPLNLNTTTSPQVHTSNTSTGPFDLHLPNPPTPIPLPDNVAKLPRAIALQDHIPSASGRKLPLPPGYTGEMLEFLAGGVITGVMFPEKWDGKWCLGRHDGQFGAFSVRGVEICLPVGGECPVKPEKGEGEGGEGKGKEGKGAEGGGAGMVVVSRWKWMPEKDKDKGGAVQGKEGGGWLSFGKTELICDVQSAHADSWCWSGTNRQGKTGLFPKSHVDLRTLAKQNKSAGKEKRKGMGFFSRR